MARKPKKNLLLEITHLAMEVCRRRLPDYRSPFSKHTFTQPQLMTCLILKACLKQDYRGLEDQLEVSDKLQEAMGLRSVPDHTTLKKFADRAASPQVLDELVAEVLALCQEKGLVAEDLGIDSTGLQSGGASVHYIARSGKRGRHYVKLSLAVVCGSLLAAGMVLSRGPSHDLCEARELLWKVAGRCDPSRIYMDKAFDAEWVHVFCRDGWGTASFIPPVIKTPDGSIRTPHRAKMADLPACYGRRWHSESFFSGLKRVCGDRVLARSDAARFTEAGLKVLAYSLRR